MPYGSILKNACPDCGQDMILKKSKYGPFYGCAKFPSCRAAHGAHSDGRPLGIPANKATKRARIAAHKTFDMLWDGDNPLMGRKDAYRWMQNAMDLSKEDAHIGRFSEEQCEQLKHKVMNLLTRKD